MAGGKKNNQPDATMKTIKTLASLPDDLTTSLPLATPSDAPRPVRVDRTTPSRAEIETRAYAIWTAQGRPHGQDLRHWFEAERQLRRP